MYTALLWAFGKISARKKHCNEDDHTCESGEEVWLLDNAAVLDPNSDGEAWTVEYKTKYYAVQSSSKLKYAATKGTMMFGGGNYKGSGGDRQAVEGSLAERIAPFFNGATVNERCKIRVDADMRPPKDEIGEHGEQGKTYELGPSDLEGRSENVITLRGTRGNGEVMTTRVLESDLPAFECRTVFVKPEGWAVISDIDDTVKQTATDRRGLVEATTDPKPVAGTPDFYKFMAEQLNDPMFWVSRISSLSFFQRACSKGEGALNEP